MGKGWHLRRYVCFFLDSFFGGICRVIIWKKYALLLFSVSKKRKREEEEESQLFCEKKGQQLIFSSFFFGRGIPISSHVSTGE